MTTLAHGAIVAKVVELLGAALPTVPVFRNRLRPIRDDQAAAIVVRKTGSDPLATPYLGHPVDWLTQVRVECYARGSDSGTAEVAADALLLQAHAVVMTPGSGVYIGGLVAGIEPPRLGWEDADHDTTLSAAVAQYAMQHRTTTNTLEAAS